MIRKSIIKLALWRKGLLPKIRLFQEQENISPHATNMIQRQLLERLLHHAREKVPYYRHLYSAGTLLNDIPPLTKDIIRANDLRASDIKERNAKLNTSGGSIGEPVPIWQCQQYRDWNTAIKIYALQLMQGTDYGEKMIKIWGSELDYRQSQKERIRYSLMNVETLPCYDMTKELAEKYRRRWNRTKPQVVWGYMSSLKVFSEMLNGEYLHRPKVIISTSETLSEPIRKRMESRFGCPVVVHYGSREVGSIATGCKESNGMLHSHELFNKIEIIDNEIYVTNLWNYAMPLIRYKIGDMAIAGDGRLCSCGLTWPLIGQIYGRISDQFKTRDGKVIHGERLTELFYGAKEVKQFQVIQESYDKVQVSIVPNKRFIIDDQTLSRIRVSISNILGNNTKVHFQFTNRIPVSASGKRRYTISNVKEN